MARFTFSPGADLDLGVAPGPEVLIGEIGLVTVAVAQPSLFISAAAPERGWRAAAGPIVLGPGDALLVAADVGREIRNERATPATALGLLLYPEPRSSYRHWEPEPSGPAYRILFSPSRVGRPAIWGHGVAVDVLASGVMRGSNASAASLALGWLTLGPKQSMPSHRVAGAELLAVASGVALVAGSQPAGDSPTIADAASDDAAPLVAAQRQRLLMGGDGVAFSTGISSPVDQVGVEPARALLVVVRPAPAGAGATLASPI
jgi:hypothetical protein